MTSVDFRDRIAAAPISWGVCEAPSWGHEMAAARVLAEMRAVGLRATELGPAGYLAPDPAGLRSALTEHELRLIGAFVPVPMHVARDLDLTAATEEMRTLAAAGAEVVVFAARSADGSYERRVELDADEWPTLLHNLDRLQTLARDLGLRPALHPHVGTAVESRDDVQRVLHDSDVELCLDTGHLLIGGTDPVQLVASHADRIAHVHLKDVDLDVAARVRAGELSYVQGVRAGLYTPLGQGNVDVAACVAALEAGGYDGWYVLEQDCTLDADPAAGTGPIENVRASMGFLTGLVRA